MGTLCFSLGTSQIFHLIFTLVINSHFLSLWLQISTATERCETLVCHKIGSSVYIARASSSTEEVQK